VREIILCRVLLRLVRMIYDTVLARSFSKHEQKRLGYWALIACLFIVLSFFTIFKPYLGPLQVCKSSIILALLQSKLRISISPHLVESFRFIQYAIRGVRHLNSNWFCSEFKVINGRRRETSSL